MRRLLLLIFLFLYSCSTNNDEFEVYELFTPIVMTMDEVRATVAVEEPQEIQVTGKIYVKDQLLLVGDEKRGIHIFDNSQPESPHKIAFLAIPGNHDMEIRGNYLYADSYKDLLVFDLSDINQIDIRSRKKEVFPYQIDYPQGDELPYDINWEGIDFSNSIVVGWERSKEIREKQDYHYDNVGVAESVSDTATNGSTGQGGSLARFKIVGHYLYTLDDSMLNVFDISDALSPNKVSDSYVTWAAETLFLSGDHMFVGSRDGVYIYDVSSPANPEYVSEFTHSTMCDPVVVYETTAFVTLRGGNMCGDPWFGAEDQALESRLDILDVSNIKKPTLVTHYVLENPYGLGVKGDLLFICDGTAGLKVYDKSDLTNLQLLATHNQMEAFDVIPLESHLILIAKEGIFQFSYDEDNTISLISHIVLN